MESDTKLRTTRFLHPFSLKIIYDFFTVFFLNNNNCIIHLCCITNINQMQRKISNNYVKILTFIHTDKSFLRNIQCKIESKMLSTMFLVLLGNLNVDNNYWLHYICTIDRCKKRHKRKYVKYEIKNRIHVYTYIFQM